MAHCRSRYGQRRNNQFVSKARRRKHSIKPDCQQAARGTGKFSGRTGGGAKSRRRSRKPQLIFRTARSSDRSVAEAKRELRRRPRTKRRPAGRTALQRDRRAAPRPRRGAPLRHKERKRLCGRSSMKACAKINLRPRCAAKCRVRSDRWVRRRDAIMCGLIASACDFLQYAVRIVPSESLTQKPRCPG
jgi:hypothetical protein